MKKLIVLLLATLMIVSTFASCSDSTASNDTSAADTSSDVTEAIDTEQLSDAELRRLIPDDLPAKDFGKNPYRVACEENKVFEIWSEDLTGESTNDAVFNRNLAIEDRFNTTIESIETVDCHSAVKTTVTSGSYDYELVGFRAFLSYTPITAKCLRNWYDIPNVNLEKPWYNKITNDAATFNGQLFNATCSLGITQMQYTYAMFFNTRLLEENGYKAEDLYNLVYEDEWVYDKFYEIVSAIYVDTNGNGRQDIKDIFGYQCGYTHPLDVWLAAFDQPITGKDSDGYVTVEFITDKTVSALEKIYKLTYETPAAYYYASTEYAEFKNFANAKVAICPRPFRVAYSELRDMEDTYGILPYPKWDANQTRYLTNIYDQYSVFGVPKSVPDDSLEFVGVVFEALNAGSYKTVYPEFYDVALKKKYSSDPNAAAMVDLVMEGANMDFSYMFGESNMQRIPYFFRDLIAAKSTDIASKYGKIQKVLNKQLDKLYTYYEY